MEDITNENIEVFADFYKQLGVDPERFFNGQNIINIFDFLNICPNVDSEGNRQLTPYEILGVLPNIKEGEEKPIIFFIKNKFRGLKLTSLNHKLDLYFSKETNKHEESLIDFAVKNYKTAIIQNNLAEAERQFEILDKMTGGKAKHYIGEFYDYTKFYKQMKKQLLIDIFSHFFITYLMKKKSIIKAGLIVKNKKFRAYNSYKMQMKQPEIKSIKIDSVNNVSADMPESQKTIEVDFDKEIKSVQKKCQDDKKKTSNSVLDKKHIVQQIPEKKSFLKKLKKKLFRKDKKLKISNNKNNISENHEQLNKMEEEVSSYE